MICAYYISICLLYCAFCSNGINVFRSTPGEDVMYPEKDPRFCSNGVNVSRSTPGEDVIYPEIGLN